MDIRNQPIGLYIRIVAIASLMLGLNDAARLLGVNTGAISPLDTMGMTGFVLLAIFALARLFAAVGLWIRAAWGGVLLVGATSVELALYLMGSTSVGMTAFGFGLRLVLVTAIVAMFAFGVYRRRQRATE